MRQKKKTKERKNTGMQCISIVSKNKIKKKRIEQDKAKSHQNHDKFKEEEGKGDKSCHVMSYPPPRQQLTAASAPATASSHPNDQ